jgi:hexulose-6-phosphate isomerase
MDDTRSSVNRRRFLAAGTASVAGAALACGAPPETTDADAPQESPDMATTVVRPPEGKRILLSVKLGMVPGVEDGKTTMPLADRLKIAAKAGFDGVDLDQAGLYTPEEAREAVQSTGVFVHNAINHDHWKMRLTSADEGERAQGRANIEHCIRVSHAAGGSGVLIVIGRADDGTPEETVERSRQEIKKLLPLAASLGQMILIENVWNKMFYDHDAGPEQSPDQFIEYVDSFNSPWIGMYFDIGNHWKYGQPGDWIRAFGRRCVKLDAKGFSREKNDWADIGEGDLPWADVRKALDEIGFAGWAAAEVEGGDVDRLTLVQQQLDKALRS